MVPGYHRSRCCSVLLTLAALLSRGAHSLKRPSSGITSSMTSRPMPSGCSQAAPTRVQMAHGSPGTPGVGSVMWYARSVGGLVLARAGMLLPGGRDDDARVSARREEVSQAYQRATTAQKDMLIHLTHEQRYPQPFACRFAGQEVTLPLRQQAACAVVLGLRVG
jgi:hypothetical protein